MVVSEAMHVNCKSSIPYVIFQVPRLKGANKSVAT